jgi:hypothetical protein
VSETENPQSDAETIGVAGADATAISLAPVNSNKHSSRAPHWGRLHLKWGETLFYAGKRDDAQKQFARAAGLDLAPSEKSELAKAGGDG